MPFWKWMQHCYLLKGHLNALCNRIGVYVHTSSWQWIIEETFNGFTCTAISATNTASIFLSIRSQNIITTYMLRTDKNKYFNRMMVLHHHLLFLFEVFVSSLRYSVLLFIYPVFDSCYCKWVFTYQGKKIKENKTHLGCYQILINKYFALLWWLSGRDLTVFHEQFNYYSYQ